MSRKRVQWNLEKAQDYFESRGCKLLETEYINYSTPMRYKAQCGHEHKITMNNFLRGKGDLCKACRYARLADKRRLSTDTVREALAAECCELLDDEVLGWRPNFRYVAQCGHENSINFSHWVDGGGRVCSTCSKSIRYTKEFVEAAFKERGCELIGEYVNCKTPVEYRDIYGKKRTTTFDLFLNGRNDRDRESGLPPWREFVFSRDDYTCQVCGERGCRLEAHHLMSYADNEEYRTDPENGVTLCKACHRKFHNVYGYGHNTRDQFDEWRREYRGKAEN